jgi:hypothetical protein
MTTACAPSWTPLLAALDAAPAPLHFFVRDDDAGWDNTRLFALLRVTEAAGLPIDLALIPQATGAALAASLGMRKQATPVLIGLHQHGFAHTNHETTARKCEFGDARDATTQRDDLLVGQTWLQSLFGAHLDATFTPPWNRCSAYTPALLAELGFALLSRSSSAPAQHALPELSVHVDWCKQRRMALAQGEDGAHAIATALAQRVAAGGPVGLMLHHADMDAQDLALFSGLLRATRRHPHAVWSLMRDVPCSGSATTGAALPLKETS